MYNSVKLTTLRTNIVINFRGRIQLFTHATVPFIIASTKFTHEVGFRTFTFILSNPTKANATSQGPFFQSNVT